jgi:uncharacterized protein (DUF2141 family)
MKQILSLVLFIILSIATFAQGKIQVTVSNIQPLKGAIRVGLFNNEDDFPDRAIAGKIEKVFSDKVIVTFEGLTAGDYAVSVFHDENENEKLDTNFMGIPKEGFGFGNNVMGTFGPPPFQKAKVKVDGNTVVQEISLRHF